MPKRAIAPAKRTPAPKVGKVVKLKTPPPGPVDDLDGFDEEDGGGVITQVATHERETLLDEELHDDLEFSEPGDDTPKPDMPSPNISTMPRPQPTQQPTRRVISQSEAQRAARGGSNPGNPVKSTHPFRGGSVLNGREWPDVDSKFCGIIFQRVRSRMTENGVMNVRNQSKLDVRNAFLQVMYAPFENKEYFSDMVAQFCKVYNILKD